MGIKIKLSNNYFRIKIKLRSQQMVTITATKIKDISLIKATCILNLKVMDINKKFRTVISRPNGDFRYKNENCRNNKD